MPIDQLGENVSWPAATIIVALLVAFVALAAINAGVAMVVGIMVLLFGGDFLKELSEAVSSETSVSADVATGDALNRLRVRYAEGDLSDEEFERRLETLLETETVDDVAAFLDDDDRAVERGHVEPTPNRSLERSER